jgi:hypothetical protein
MPPITFKCIQRQHAAIFFGVYVCLLPLVTLITELTLKSRGIILQDVYYI